MVGRKLAQKLPLEQLQPQWAAQINPVLECPIVNGRLIENIHMAAGANVINHGLGRNLVGWIAVRMNFLTVLNDSQDTNPKPDLTLFLTSTAPAVISLWVF